MSSKVNKIIALPIVIIVIILTFMFLFKENHDFSDTENRYLETRPQLTLKNLFDGTYIYSFEKYMRDQFPFRDKFNTIKTTSERALGKDDLKGIYFSKDGYLIEEYKSPKNSDKIIKQLNGFNEELNYVNMNLMLVPTSVAVNKHLLPSNAPIQDQLKELDYIYDKINFDVINLYDTFIENNKRYQMFYRLDEHWTTYGAYYAYTKYAEANNLKINTLNSFDIKEESTDFNGSMYSKINEYNLESDSIYSFTQKQDNFTVEYVTENKKTDSLYQSSYLNKKDKYAYFLGGDYSLVIVTNNNIKTNKELVLIKDSYANSIVSFIAAHYKKVHVIDTSLYNGYISEYIKSNKNINDLLFLYNMNTLDLNSGILTIK